MSYVTWGVNAHKEATIFCMRCRATFDQNVPAGQAKDARDAAAADHHCTPMPPRRPGRKHEH